jgi:hypothetical protein
VAAEGCAAGAPPGDMREGDRGVRERGRGRKMGVGRGRVERAEGGVMVGISQTRAMWETSVHCSNE